MSDRAVFDAICEEVRKGALVQNACKANNIGTSTLHRWLDESEELRELYARVRIEQAHAMAEAIVDIADTCGEDANGINKARARMDARKFLVAKIAPKIYGDKLDVTSDGKELTLSALLAGTFKKPE